MARMTMRTSDTPPGAPGTGSGRARPSRWDRRAPDCRRTTRRHRRDQGAHSQGTPARGAGGQRGTRAAVLGHRASDSRPPGAGRLGRQSHRPPLSRPVRTLLGHAGTVAAQPAVHACVCRRLAGPTICARGACTNADRGEAARANRQGDQQLPSPRSTTCCVTPTTSRPLDCCSAGARTGWW